MALLPARGDYWAQGGSSSWVGNKVCLCDPRENSLCGDHESTTYRGCLGVESVFTRRNDKRPNIGGRFPPLKTPFFPPPCAELTVEPKVSGDPIAVKRAISAASNWWTV
ncbi:unnamed protein product [Hapterophycus canaliculatus]